MKKEKKELFEKMVFDDVAYAASVKEESEGKLKKCRDGLVIAAIASVYSFIGFEKMESSMAAPVFLGMALLLAVVSYVLSKGWKYIFKFPVKIGLWLWRTVPVFGADMLAGAVGLVFGFFGVVFFPVVAVGLMFVQIKKNRDSAKEYLEFCKPADAEAKDNDEEKPEDTAESDPESGNAFVRLWHRIPGEVKKYACWILSGAVVMVLTFIITNLIE